MAKIDYKSLTTAADFTKAAASFDRRNQSVKTDFQHALICALKHMEACGDYTNTLMPLLACGKGFGKALDKTLKEYVLKYTWLELDGKAWAKNKDKAMNIAGAEAKSWWEAEPDTKGKPFDFQLALVKLIESMSKELTKDGTSLTREGVASAMLAETLKLANAEDVVEAAFAKVADEDKFAVVSLLMAEVPAPVQSVPDAEVEQEEIAA